MIKNFITDTELEEHYPNLSDYLPDSLSSWSSQVSEAFELVLNDLRSRELDVRTMGIGLDLKRAADSSADQNTLTSSTEATSTTGTHIVGKDGFRRFCINVTALSGTASIAIQGSNDQNITDSTEPTNWTTIATLTPTAIGESSVMFDSQYKYYRRVSTVSGSVTYTACLYEVYFDIWIIYKTYWIIFNYLSKNPDDVWDKRAKMYDTLYSAVLSGYKFTVDSNDDNLITNQDEQNKSGQRRMSR
jgi:hypothetical protein